MHMLAIYKRVRCARIPHLINQHIYHHTCLPFGGRNIQVLLPANFNFPIQCYQQRGPWTSFVFVPFESTCFEISSTNTLDWELTWAGDRSLRSRRLPTLGNGVSEESVSPHCYQPDEAISQGLTMQSPDLSHLQSAF